MGDERTTDAVRSLVFGVAATSLGTIAATAIQGASRSQRQEDAYLTWLVVALIVGASIAAFVAWQGGRRRHAESMARLEGVAASVDGVRASVSMLTDMTISHARSDLIHRAAKYIGDRATDRDTGWCTVEEKTSWLADYERYKRLTESAGIENGYIDDLSDRISALRTRRI